MTKQHRTLWARALIEAGKTTIFLALLILGIIWIEAVAAHNPAATLILGILIAYGSVILRDYWREWRTHAHT